MHGQQQQAFSKREIGISYWSRHCSPLAKMYTRDSRGESERRRENFIRCILIKQSARASSAYIEKLCELASDKTLQFRLDMGNQIHTFTCVCVRVCVRENLHCCARCSRVFARSVVVADVCARSLERTRYIIKSAPLTFSVSRVRAPLSSPSFMHFYSHFPRG